MIFFTGERFNFCDHVSFLRGYFLISKKCNISCYVNIIPPLGRDAAMCHVLEMSRFNFFFKKFATAPSISFTLQLGIFMVSSYITPSLLTSYLTSIARYFSFDIEFY